MIKTKSIGKGQTINSAYPQDNASYAKLPDEMGGKLAGSCENLSHSLSGASTVGAGSLGTK